MPLDVNARLEELRKDAQREWRAAQKTFAPATRKKKSRRALWADIALAVVRGAAIVALPFVAYVRTSVFFYNHSAPSWLALTGGALLTLGVVAAYVAWFARRFRGRAKVERMLRWVALPTVVAWCLYSAIFLARVNAKSDEVHRYYSSVHPILRVALSTIILVDPDLVITDSRRVAEDYVRMGLPVNDRTLHYRQRDGWVHAVDLRTRERSALKNRVVQFYFWSMGFSTLRHVGTADHLHVQLR
jgi:multisubunit Na+/H+ antiporter MnhB subunit